jgi:hypothetical protein
MPETSNIPVDGSRVELLRGETLVGEGMGHYEQLERHLAIGGDHGLAGALLQLVPLRLQVVGVSGGVEHVDGLHSCGATLLVPKYQVNPVGQLLPATR